METIQTPSLIKNPIHISHGPADILCGICSQDGSKAWMVKEDCLHCVSMKNGEIIQKWKCTFGDIYCVKEVICGMDRFLAVAAISSETDTSVLVLLNVLSLSVIKSIYFTEKVSSLDSFEFLASDRTAYEKILSTFDGVLAVGCHGGETYLINLQIHRSATQFPMSIKVINEKGMIQEETTNAGDLAALLLVQGKK